jgi:outer membrane beta-barrel protein
VIRNLAAIALLSLLLLGARAHAQFEGLDLSDDSKTKKDTKPKKDDAEGGLDLSGPSTPEPTTTTPAKSKDEPKKPVAKKAEGPVGERDITQEDRVISVQRKLYMKRGRFELAPSVNFAINDPYYTKYGAQLRMAFYPADNLAISARFGVMQTLPTDDVRVAKKNLQAKIFFSNPMWVATADIEWSPLYGKVAFLNSILHFDGYFIGGGGAVYSETSAKNQIWPAFDLGIGMRFVAKDFLAVNVALVNTSYTDIPTGTDKAAQQNLLMLNAGVSLFFPFKSTFREAE